MEECVRHFERVDAAFEQGVEVRVARVDDALLSLVTAERSCVTARAAGARGDWEARGRARDVNRGRVGVARVRVFVSFLRAVRIVWWFVV